MEKIHIGNRIKYLIGKRKIKIIDFAKQVGISREAAHKILNKEDISLKRLDIIAEVLGYTATQLIDPELKFAGEIDPQIIKKSGEIELLKETIKERDKTIELLNRIIKDKGEIIELLKRKNENKKLIKKASLRIVWKIEN